MIYAVENSAHIALIEARNPKQAENKMLRLFGSMNGPCHVRQATKQDKSWVMTMQGVETVEECLL